MADTNGHADGRVLRVIGPVVDVEFPPNQLPEINNALKIDITMGGETTTITCEVAQHIGDSSIRAIALKPTDGLVRGSHVRNTGAPIMVPVGEGVLGHVYNVLGEPLDADMDSINASDSWAIHREAPGLRRSRAQEDHARDGDQGHRPARAVRPGRQDRHVRWCGRGQDGRDPGDDPSPGAAARWRVGVRRCRRAHPRGQRPVPGDDRVGRPGQHRAGVRADGRAPGCASARRAVGAHDGGVLPRRRSQGRAAVRRQHLPVHPGRVGGLDAARPHAVLGGLPAEPGQRDGRPPGADHLRAAVDRSPRCRRSTCRPTT